MLISSSEAIIDGAGMVQFRAHAGFSGDEFRMSDIDAAIEIGTTINKSRVTLTTKMSPATEDGKLPKNPIWIRND